MTQDEIIRLAEEAGVHEGGKENWVAGNRWEDFAKLVAAKEHEACALMVMPLDESLADEIRARGQA